MIKWQRTFWMVLALAAVLLGGCAGGGADRPAEDREPSEEEATASKITFEGTDLEGNTVSSDIFAQPKITMVNVWATYCNPCLSEMPELGELAEEYSEEDFQLIGIVSDVLEGEDQSLVESLVQQTGADYTHLLLNESIYYAMLTDVTGVPTTFFLDGEGTVLDRVRGAKEKSVWEEKIDALLEER